jgi:hypothetical protein
MAKHTAKMLHLRSHLIQVSFLSLIFLCFLFALLGSYFVLTPFATDTLTHGIARRSEWCEHKKARTPQRMGHGGSCWNR